MFELKRRLPSCFVDKTLVRALEDQLRQRLCLGDTAWLRLEITHRSGRVKLGSIEEHEAAQFVDDTAEMALFVRVHEPHTLDVRVQFSVSRSDSFVRVRYSDEVSRELAMSLVAEVEQLVLEQRTWNSLFSLDVAVSGLMDGLAAGVIVFAVYVFTFGSRVPRWSILVGLLLPLYRLIGFFKPYSVFETPQTPTLNMLGNWLTAGLAGLVLLTALGAYFDIGWLGF